MKRQEYVFTIGYSGDTAIIDGKAMRQYSSLSTEELVSRGFYRQAMASALFSANQQEAETVLARYNQAAGADFQRPEQLERVFGLVKPEGLEVKPRILK